MTTENFGPGIVGGVVLVDPMTGLPYRASVTEGAGGVSSWNDLTDKPTTFPPTIGATSTTAVAGDDARLTDQRVPTDGSVTNAKVSGSAAISLDKTADTGTRVAMTPAERTKLSGVATAATANATDAALRDRSTHTGTQAISTVTGLQTALDGKQASGSYAAASHTHAAADVASGTIDVARLPVGTGAAQVAAGNHSHSGTYAPASHTHASTDITDSTATGRTVLAAADAAAVRAAAGVVDATTAVKGLTQFADAGTAITDNTKVFTSSWLVGKVLSIIASALNAVVSGAGVDLPLAYATAYAQGARPSIPANWCWRIWGGSTSDPDPAWMIDGDYRDLTVA